MSAKKINLRRTSTYGALAVNTRKAANMIGCSESYLRKARGLGTGPAYCKIGERVVYRVRDLYTYLKANLKS